jgi:hypothetical protein
MTTKDNILTEEERTALKSMARYWDEVAKQEDASPLEQELLTVYRKLGYKILPIIARYLELTEGPDK